MLLICLNQKVCDMKQLFLLPMGSVWMDQRRTCTWYHSQCAWTGMVLVEHGPPAWGTFTQHGDPRPWPQPTASTPHRPRAGTASWPSRSS